MITQWLPWGALAVSLVAFWTGGNSGPKDSETPTLGKSAHIAGAIAVVLGIVALVLGTMYKDKLAGIQPAGIAAFGGLILSAALGFLGSRFDAFSQNVAAPIAFGATAVAFCQFFPAEDRAHAMLGLACGLGAGAWLLVPTPTLWPATSAIVSFTVAAASSFGEILSLDRAISFPVLLVLSIAAIAAAIQNLASSQANRKAVIPLLIALISAGAGYLLGAKFLFLRDAGFTAALACGAALVTHWIMPSDSEPAAGSKGLSALLWIGVATIAFSLQRGFGMSIAAMVGSATLMGLRNHRAVYAMGGLVALACFRWLLEISTQSKALDIGQHYGMMGLIIGVALLVIGADWLTSIANRKDVQPFIGAMLWIGALACLPGFVAIVLGPKGFVGALVGYGLGTVLALFTKTEKPGLFPLFTALASLSLLQYPWLVDYVDLARSEKLKYLWAFAITLTLLSAGIALLARSKNHLEGSPQP